MTHVQIMTAVAAAVAATASAPGGSAALTPVGEPVAGDSFTQTFQQSGGGPFNYIEFEMVQGQFGTPTLADFSVPGWQEVYSDGTTAVATGPAVTSLQWDVHFDSDINDDIEFRYVVYNAGAAVYDARAERESGQWVPLPFPPDSGGPLPASFGGALTLQPDPGCHNTGDAISVCIVMSGAAEPIVGGQFFLDYDTSALALNSVEPGDEPFVTEIYDVGGGGMIAYAVGVDGGGPGTTDAVCMAVLEFIAQGEVCNVADLVSFSASPVVPTQLTNDQGDAIVPALVDLGAITIDDTPPTLTIPSDATIECDGSSDPEDLGFATATDCDTAPVVGYADAIIAGACDGNYTIARTWTATDACGNEASAVQTITVQDATAPAITGCPADITVLADAGGCSAVVSWAEPTAADNCGAVSVSSTHSPGDTFPQGLTAVTYTFTDECGNASTCTFNIEVLGQSEMLVNLDVVGVDTSVERCIVFEFSGNDTGSTQHTFAVDSSGTAMGTILVPCGDYDCVTIRDPLHTLATSVSLAISGTQYSAGASLVSGNLNDDEFIDILDFGIFISQYGSNYGTGDTDCSTDGPHADFSGDGVVETGDFTFISSNFLEMSDAGCTSGFAPPPALAGGGMPQPITRISVRELHRRGMRDLVGADLNRDGWLDEQDIAAFMNGVQP